MMKLRIIATLLAVGGVASPGWNAAAPAPPSNVQRVPLVSETEAPAGMETLAAQWIRITVPDRGVLLAAVARPSGLGSFPSVVLLHGTHGFLPQYVEWAQALARDGFLAVTGCWFSGSGGSGANLGAPPIPCPDAAPFTRDAFPERMWTVDALVQATRALPGTRADRIALVGHSRGGGATVEYLLSIGNVQAAVLHSSGYAMKRANRAADFKAPILIMHGTADGPSDGGSAATDVALARELEAALRQSGKQVEAMYYEGGGHNTFFSNPTQHNDELKRMVAFLGRHLGS